MQEKAHDAKITLGNSICPTISASPAELPERFHLSSEQTLSLLSLCKLPMFFMDVCLPVT